MRAFISYAIAGDEYYILNLLGTRLAERGLTSVTGVNPYTPLDYQASNRNSKCCFIHWLAHKRLLRHTESNMYLPKFKHANLFNKRASC